MKSKYAEIGDDPGVVLLKMSSPAGIILLHNPDRAYMVPRHQSALEVKRSAAAALGNICPADRREAMTENPVHPISLPAKSARGLCASAMGARCAVEEAQTMR